jgi:hypothetical protein
MVELRFEWSNVQRYMSTLLRIFEKMAAKFYCLEAYS